MNDSERPEWARDLEQRVIEAYRANGLLAMPYRIEAREGKCCGIGALCYGKVDMAKIHERGRAAAAFLDVEYADLAAFFAGFDDGITAVAKLPSKSFGYTMGALCAQAVIDAGLKAESW